MVMPEGDYAIVERDDVSLHLFRKVSQTQTPGSVHIFASGLDDLFGELQSRGARLIQPIVRQPWGNRDFRAEDLSGDVIKFTEPLDDSA